MDQLTLGVFARSRKEHERRLPIHPEHLDRIEPDLLSRITFEHGYGDPFGLSDDDLAAEGARLADRRSLIGACDVILLPKPLIADLEDLRDGQVLWGWPHCVQDAGLTQVAIDKKLTLIAFEAMNHWHDDGSYDLHVFHKNNELAGYASVVHALQLLGVTGEFGKTLTGAVIGFGATGRGAVTALNAHGVHEVHVLTHRDVALVASPIHSARMVHFVHADEEGTGRRVGGHVVVEGADVPLAEFLAQHDVIVNCVLQDTDAPLVFLDDDDLPALASGTLVVDVSCDEGMGFGWARPTSFADPTFVVGRNVVYYAVDHSPSYLWNSATWEISEALQPYLQLVLDGPEAWEQHETLRRAIEIQDGVVRNPHILSFQRRAADYPHQRA